MNRREFIVAAGGVSGASAAATAGTPVVAQEDGENESAAEDGETTDAGGGGAGDNESADGGAENETGGGTGGGGGTETVQVVDNAFEPAEITIQPGTTVEWVWQGTAASHNVHPTSQPEGANWEGHMPLESGDFSFESTFEVEGEYEYQCDPHVGLGMVGTVIVTSETEAAAAGNVDIHDIGVPLQKHWLGVATMLSIFVSLVFTFYLLKYGESAHTSSPGRR